MSHLKRPRLIIRFAHSQAAVSAKLRPSDFKVPRHELVDLRDFPALSDALKGLREPGVWIDVVHFCGLQKRGDSRPGSTAASGSCEQCVLRMARSTMLESISTRPSLRKH